MPFPKGEMRIIVERVDGQISILVPAEKSQYNLEEIIIRIMRPALYDGAIVRRHVHVEEWRDELTPAIPSGKWILDEEIPLYITKLHKRLAIPHDQLRYYRNTWTWKPGKGLHKDPVKVRNQDLDNLRKVRDKLLANSDSEVMPDRGPVSPEMVTYRQALREVPQQQVAHKDIVWPVKP